MYEDFFGLKEKPFNLTPSPRFLYLSEGHKEALALLKYGVMDRKGFILLTGEVGTGKTTMVRALLDSLNHTVKYVLLSNPLLSPEDFVNYIVLSVFKKKIHFSSKAHFLIVFEPYLKKALNKRENFNLIIDEAHKLSLEILEEIRLLSNMETGDEKLMNIFLVGQPELNEKLGDKRCRALLQRISVRHHIRPLNLEETREYVATRLKVAGAQKANQIFSRKAIDAIYNFSKGYPREINILADNALLLGYSRGRKEITPLMVKECYKDMQLPGVAQAKPELELSESEPEQVDTQKSNRTWKWAAVIIFFLVLLAVALSPLGKKIIWRFNALLRSTYQAAVANVTEMSSSEERAAKRENSDIPESDRIEIQKTPAQNIENHKVESQEQREAKTTLTTTEKKTKAIEERDVASRANEDKKVMETGKPKLVQSLEVEAGVQENENLPNKIVIVGRGDTLSQLTGKIYGRITDELMTMVKAANPDLKDINFIKSGQKIVFPQPPELERNEAYTVHVASYKQYDPALSMYRDLLENGYEVYILPVGTSEKANIFRVTIGYFKNHKEAKEYAVTLVKQGISTYANPIELKGKSEDRRQTTDDRIQETESTPGFTKKETR